MYTNIKPTATEPWRQLVGGHHIIWENCTFRHNLTSSYKLRNWFFTYLFI